MSLGTTAAVVGGALGAAGAVGGALIGAGAQGAAGKAQSDAANNQVQMQRDAIAAEQASRQQGVALGAKVGAMSAGEIAGIQRILSDKSTMLQSSFAALDKQQATLDAADPQVKAAGQNLFNLLNGQYAQMISPLLKQRDFQRTQMQNDLSARMGPGFATSTAGIEAMTRFDTETDATVAQAQLSATQIAAGTYSSLFGQQIQGQADITRQTQSIFQNANTYNSEALQAEQYGTTRLSNAEMAGFTSQPINFQGPAQAQGQSGVPYAGAPFAGGQTVGAGVSGAAGILYGQAASDAAMKNFGQLFKDQQSPSYNPGLTDQIANFNPNLALGSTPTQTFGSLGTG